MDKMSFTDGIIEIMIQIAPFFIVVSMLFVMLSWIRLLLDYLSGRNF